MCIFSSTRQISKIQWSSQKSAFKNYSFLFFKKKKEKQNREALLEIFLNPECLCAAGASTPKINVPYSYSLFFKPQIRINKVANKHDRFEFRFCLHEKVISGQPEISSAYFPCKIVSLLKKNMTVKSSIYLQFPSQPVLLIH